MSATRTSRKSASPFGIAMSLGMLAIPFCSAALASGEARWPASTVAQRAFPNGASMFVEDDHGKLRAWVLSESKGGAHVEAMDFFTGESMKVDVALEADGHQSASFTDAKGISHVAVGKGFAFSGGASSASLTGLDLGADSIYVKKSAAYCGSRFIAATPSPGGADAWHKFPIYHQEMSASACSKGKYWSNITSALDLDDGTFLAVEGCFVFRLKKADLSPAGDAPALRVVDKARLQAAIDEAKAKGASDTMEYVAQALGLPSSPQLSCKAE
ncbi:hypothetical protein [Luteibacter sp. ME-Dv--P-043b]|uniref:hypothetical protein n=1 Tax=Luteibacter sp. ME-Dv--P-043b TaxID=3040291 RepID=UPI002554E672|nr:hypothetical protein [Luteibacter sp. ME-Dv--P-043b]